MLMRLCFRWCPLQRKYEGCARRLCKGVARQAAAPCSVHDFRVIRSATSCALLHNLPRAAGTRFQRDCAQWQRLYRVAGVDADPEAMALISVDVEGVFVSVGAREVVFSIAPTTLLPQATCIANHLPALMQAREWSFLTPPSARLTSRYAVFCCCYVSAPKQTPPLAHTHTHNNNPQALPANTFVLVNAYTCCAGRADKWGHALRALCHRLSASWQRPVAVVSCYRRNRFNMRRPPADACTEWPCKHMEAESLEDLQQYNSCLVDMLQRLQSLECTILAVGATGIQACQLPGSLLPHAPCSYPGLTMEGCWRKNAASISRAAGYDGSLQLLDNALPGWESVVDHVCSGMLSGVCW